MLNWGILSAGRISTSFTQDFSFVTNGKVLAVAARQLDDAKKFAHKFEIERAYGDYQTLFDDPDIDIIYIGTPHNFHFEQAKAALQAGKHVLCEKPITISSEQSRHLAIIAKENGVFLMEALWTYFLPAIIQAKQWVEEGKIGQIKHIKADFGFPMPFNATGREYNPDLAGGCLLDMGIYPIAIAHYFLGEQNLDITHVEANFASTGVDDDVVIFAKSEDIKVSLAASFQCKLNNHAYIIGDKGMIEIPDFWCAKESILLVLNEDEVRFNDNRAALGYCFEAEAAANDIKNGRIESLIMPHKTSDWLQQFMEKVKANL